VKARTLIGNDLNKFVETVRVARNCRRIIFQNFYGTLVVDTIGIGLAAAGILNPLLAAFIHVASELAFILNSTRLLPPKEKTGFQVVNRTLCKYEDRNNASPYQLGWGAHSPHYPVMDCYRPAGSDLLRALMDGRVWWIDPSLVKARPQGT
jgi:hypothetical protein